MSNATMENIRLLLSITGATHQQIADIAGVDRSAVSHWKSGKAEPRMGHLQRIADFYGITTANLANPNGMKYVHKGRDGKLHDDSEARMNDIKQTIMAYGSGFSAQDVMEMAALYQSANASSTKLTKEERELIDMFRQLNKKGQGVAMSVTASLVLSGQYPKDK